MNEIKRIFSDRRKYFITEIFNHVKPKHSTFPKKLLFDPQDRATIISLVVGSTPDHFKVFLIGIAWFGSWYLVGLPAEHYG